MSRIIFYNIEKSLPQFYPGQNKEGTLCWPETIPRRSIFLRGEATVLEERPSNSVSTQKPSASTGERIFNLWKITSTLRGFDVRGAGPIFLPRSSWRNSCVPLVINPFTGKRVGTNRWKTSRTTRKLKRWAKSHPKRILFGIFELLFFTVFGVIIYQKLTNNGVPILSPYGLFTNKSIRDGIRRSLSLTKEKFILKSGISFSLIFLKDICKPR